MHIHVSTLFKILFPYRSLRSIEWSSQCHRVSHFLLYVLFIVPKPMEFLKKFYWSIVNSQCCISFRCTENDSVIHLHISTLLKIFFSHIGHNRVMSRIPCTTQQILISYLFYTSVQFSSVTQSRPTLCDPMDCSTPGLPVHHQLLVFTQTHVHQVSDAIQPSHPLSSPSPTAPKLSQHQGLFQWVNSSHEVAKVLEFQL